MSGSGERSIATLLEDIVGNIRHLVTAEIRLVTVEARHQIHRAARSAALLVLGGAIGMLALGCVCLASLDLLALVVAPWVAALIVAATAGAIAAILIHAGLRRWPRVNLRHPQATGGETIQWTKPSAG